MPRVLIIAIGNPLRSDDGLAWHAADALSRDANAPEILRVHQLAPEIAETVSHATIVIFVDAASEGTPGEVTCQNVSASATDAPFSHHLTPGVVIALAETIYAAHPTAFSVTMAGECFDHGDALSTRVVESMPGLLAEIRGIIVRAG